VEVDARRLRVERVREFGGPWLGLQVFEKLGLGAFLRAVLAPGREEIEWATMAQVLILGRLCNPSSELALAERIYARTALGDLLGVPLEKVNDDRLYRALDALLPHKGALERHLKQRLGELFALEYELLLYDVTSTYFEGLAEGNAQAQRGYSRDHRPDCAQVAWSKVEAWREWSALSEGCYLLRSNIREWSASELWEAYMQLTQAEAAFRLHKQDLSLRPIWHQKAERVQAHMLVCFLAYVLRKALGQLCQRAGLGDEPRQVLEELAQIRTVDVVLPTKAGPELRRRCVAEPTKHQAILLQRLGLALPKHLEMREV
jgi:hypothetical protein